MGKIKDHTRHRDPALLRTIRGMSCAVCGTRPVDAHHKKTRGAGGGDTIENLVPLCRKHHTEVHNLGRKTFLNKYPLTQWVTSIPTNTEHLNDWQDAQDADQSSNWSWE